MGELLEYAESIELDESLGFTDPVLITFNSSSEFAVFLRRNDKPHTTEEHCERSH